tara:strand:+ start:414 stop:2297 length:1884 start_codon:yes stop_codon:yes gene_type:complete
MKNNLLIKRKEHIVIFCISFFLFFIKWYFSFFFYSDEGLLIKVINESSSTFFTFDSYTYFHYIKSLAEFNFDSIYDPDLKSKYFLLIPYGSVVFHSFFYKLIGNISFIFLEFIAILLFIIIFYSIFRLISFSKNVAILLAVIFYTMPDFLYFFNNFNIVELGSFSGNFFNLRFPRPFVSNILFFTFILILLKSHIEQNLFANKNLLSLSFIFGMTLSSFFFLFLTEVITFIFYLLIFYKKDIFNVIKSNLKKIIYSIFLFLLITLPFFFLINYTNPDYSERMGIIEISSTDKIFLIKHYLYKLFRLKLILVYLTLIISYLFMKKFNKENLKFIFIFYLLFISSIIAPFAFILLSNKIAFLYHLNNTVVVCLMLLILMLVILNCNLIFQKIKFNIKTTYLSSALIFFIIITYNFNIYYNYIENLDDKLRIDRKKITNFLIQDESIDLSKSSLLTFDRKIMTWALFNNNRDLYVVDGTFSIKSSSFIEDDLINLFKFFKLSDDDFLKFISNKKIGYRYNNPVLKTFFWQKYTANSFYTFKRSQDFEKKTLSFIINSSPFYSHQFAIPKFEITRLMNKFNSNTLRKKNDPNIIIINKKNKFFYKMKVDNKYCKILDGDELVLYIEKTSCD